MYVKQNEKADGHYTQRQQPRTHLPQPSLLHPIRVKPGAHTTQPKIERESKNCVRKTTHRTQLTCRPRRRLHSGRQRDRDDATLRVVTGERYEQTGMRHEGIILWGPAGYGE